ncbi:MAG: ferrochelatase [Candidatus Tectomicrobia bacterium]|nr:ferrochelatase [Candidatus Tectomicrobia bacterium]
MASGEQTSGGTSYDSILLIAFGGPTSGDQSYDYVKGIVGNRAGAEPRIRAVARHYEHFDGSPFNEHTFRQAEHLRAALARRGLDVPVYCGMRHWHPYVREVLARMAEAGCRNTLGVIMAPHQCWISWDWYQNCVNEGNGRLGDRRLTFTYVDPWWQEPAFIEANAARLQEAFARLCGQAAQAQLIFSAHAIPINACQFCKNEERRCPYSVQFEETARLVAQAVGRGADYLTCYQSQAGVASEWTRPAVREVIAACKQRGVGAVVISPIGFLVDHIEVLWDLDMDVKKLCEEYRITYERAETVESHPAFIELLADRVLARYQGRARLEAPLH